MNDTIAKPITIHLENPISDVSFVTDSFTESMAYQISFDVPKNEDRQLSGAWIGALIGLLVAVLAVVVWFRLRRKSQNRQLASEGSQQENVLRMELLRQSEAYKVLVEKGYFSKNKKLVPESLNNQEIEALCDAVVDVFVSFLALLREKALADKDFQFCCLVKSGLSTFELSEIYCVSESAIFKRKQKLKGQLGFKSDARTLDSILQTL